jgi:diguanylate cyclase (GGDEF)-like protein
MNSLIAFLLAMVYVCLGFAVGVWMTRRGSANPTPPGRGGDNTAGDATATLTSEEASNFFDRIQQVTSNVDKDVGRHATRVAEISGELSSGDSKSSVNVLAAAARLLEANKGLQQDLAEARAEIQLQRNQVESYMEQAVTDALTGLANRRGFDQELSQRVARRRRGGPPLSLVLVDVDHFKRFNDEHGHQAGDAVLSQVADVLTESTRQMDFLARYGGEEFSVVLPGTTLEEAKVVAERIRGAVEKRAFKFHGKQLHVTVSAGLAEADIKEEEAALLGRTDAAMYAAKNAGRNLCQWHDGTKCHPLEKQDPLRRRKANSSQRIAPFVDGQFPEPGMFGDIACEDVSATHFSYVVSERPDYDKVLVALSETADCSYATATVEHCRNIGSPTSPLYRIICRFTAPVDCFAETAAT